MEEDKIPYRKIVAIKGYAIKLIKNDRQIKEIIEKRGNEHMDFVEMVHRFIEAKADVVN